MDQEAAAGKDGDNCEGDPHGAAGGAEGGDDGEADPK